MRRDKYTHIQPIMSVDMPCNFTVERKILRIDHHLASSYVYGSGSQTLGSLSFCLVVPQSLPSSTTVSTLHSTDRSLHTCIHDVTHPRPHLYAHSEIETAHKCSILFFPYKHSPINVSCNSNSKQQTTSYRNTPITL